MAVVPEQASRYLPQTQLTTVGWHGARDLEYHEWLRQGSRLGLASRSSGWWIGDWVRYGTERYGSKYAAAARVTGYDRQTLMNMVYVATRFEFSRRRENLSWSHHAELAKLGVEDQERWLDRAAAERLSVRDLRFELAPDKERRARVSAKAAASPLQQARVTSQAHASERVSSADDAPEHVAVCPHCGHTFVA